MFIVSCTLKMKHFFNKIIPLLSTECQQCQKYIHLKYTVYK